MTRRAWVVWLLGLLMVLGGLSSEMASGAVTARQRTAINTLKRKAAQVEQLCAQDKYDEAAAALKEIQKDYDQLRKAAQKDKDLVSLLEPLYSLMLRPHARMELEGIELPPLEKPVADDGTPAGGGVSFRRQIAPILVTKCGRCHVDRTRGMFSMATFAALMKGSEAGVVVTPKDDMASRLIEVIETGDMPRGGDKVTAEELVLLKAWIREGARYDAPDPQVRLTVLAPDATTEAPMIEVTRSSGKETVSFANELAPVLAASCGGCHGNGNQNGGQFNLVTFQAMLRGGDSGPPVLPKQAADSLLIRKLKGTAGGARMPRGQPPLPDSVIAKFETWIEEGATFDGHDPRANVVEVAELAKALRSNHEQLSADRAERADRNWQLGMPGIDADKSDTEHFALLGNIGPATLGDLGTNAEQWAGKVADLFKAPDGQPLIKGRMTLFVFAGRYDYSEFGKMIEQRDIPTQWRGHWRYSTVDAYGAMMAQRGDENANDAMLVQLIAGTYVASLGRDVPRWFAEGAARAAAARLVARDPRVAEWDEQATSVLSAMSQPDDFLTGQLAPEATDIASYHFVNFLMSRDARRFFALLKALREGEPFANAFLAVYNATPAQVAPAWLQYEARRRR